MKIPRSLKINGSRWKVRVVRGLEDKEDAVGLCKRWSKTIVIEANQTREERAVTLLHEILHALWPVDVVGDRTEEKIVDALDIPLYATLVQNKLLSKSPTAKKRKPRVAVKRRRGKQR